jgi:fructosamine-3-kinase
MRNQIDECRALVGGIARLLWRTVASLNYRLVWLYVRFVGVPTDRRAMDPVRAHYGKAPPCIGQRSHIVVRLLDSQGWPRPLIARFYKPTHSILGLRYLCIKAILRRQGLAVPQTLAHDTLQLGDASYFTTVEKVVSGKHPTAWSEGLAFALGKDLAYWHQVRMPLPVRTALRIQRWTPSAYREEATKRFHHLEVSHEMQCTDLSRAFQGLDSEAFRGSYVLSHGDLWEGNIIVGPDERLVWLDFDAACWRPRRHDLAEAEVLMLRKFPEVIDAFERGYFDIHPEEQAGWRQHRLGWYRIYCSWRALKLLIRQKEDPTFDTEQKEFGALSSTCWEVDDVGQPASCFVESILRHAQRKLLSQKAARRAEPGLGAAW